MGVSYWWRKPEYDLDEGESEEEEELEEEEEEEKGVQETVKRYCQMSTGN
jgi:hypothetical protein